MTAAQLAGATGARIVIDDRLIDRDYGQWSGVSAGEIEAEFGSLDDAPGVEGMSSVASRAMAALADVPSMWSKGPAAVIAHDAVNCRILAEVSAGPAGIIQRTGCWNLLVRSGEGWSAPVVNAIPGDGIVPSED
jgi:broad specificity phosphatase PhoE